MIFLIVLLVVVRVIMVSQDLLNYWQIVSLSQILIVPQQEVKEKALDVSMLAMIVMEI